MQSKKYINKKTGEIVTQVPIMQIADYEEYTTNHEEIIKQGTCKDCNKYFLQCTCLAF